MREGGGGEDDLGCLSMSTTRTRTRTWKRSRSGDGNKGAPSSLSVWSRGESSSQRKSIDSSLSPVRELRTIPRLPHSGLCQGDNRWKHNGMVPACVRRDGRSRGGVSVTVVEWWIGDWGLGLTIDGTAAGDLRWGVFFGALWQVAALQRCGWPPTSPHDSVRCINPHLLPGQRPWTCTLCSIEGRTGSLKKRGPTLMSGAASCLSIHGAAPTSQRAEREKDQTSKAMAPRLRRP